LYSLQSASNESSNVKIFAGDRSYLVHRSRVRKVEHLDVPLCRTNNHQRVLNVKGIAPLRQMNRSHGVRGTQIPVLGEKVRRSSSFKKVRACTNLDSLVPAAGCQNTTLRRLNPSHTLYRCVVLRNLCRLSSRHVKHSACIIGSPRKYLCPVLIRVQ